MDLVTASGLAKSFGGQVLFQNVGFRIGQKDHIGLVGPNGVGKTTLLRMLTGECRPDAGGFTTQQGLRVGYLEQHACSDGSRTALEETLSVFESLMRMERELEETSERLLHRADEQNIQRQHELQERFIAAGGLTFRSRAAAVLKGLGFSAQEQALDVSKLSGGQRAKVGLAKLLLCKPQLMLLDEPTNHLDIPCVEWLENYLISYTGAILVVSHDRYFLDRVCNRIFSLRGGVLEAANGNYTQYLKQARQARAALEKQYESVSREIKRLEEMIDQQRRFNQARNYVTIASKQHMLERLKASLPQLAYEPRQMRFAFPVKQPGGNEVLTVEGLSKHFNGLCLYQNVRFSIRKGECVFLVGPNGCGKTTLLRQILEMPAGVRFGAGVSAGYFDQLGANLDASKTVFDEIHDAYPHMSGTQVRNALALFSFYADACFTKIGDLSGGERARVALLKRMLSADNLLLLDEPTNHLDLRAREGLEQALHSYEGTILAVSHDRYLINLLADRILAFENGTVNAYAGNYDAYLEKRPDGLQIVPTPAKTAGAGGKAYAARKQRQSAQNRLRGAITRCQAAINACEEEIQRLERQLSEPQIAADYEQAMRISAQLDQENARLDDLLHEWIALEQSREKEEADA